MNMIAAFEDTLDLAFEKDFDCLDTQVPNTDWEHLKSMLARVKDKPDEFSEAKLGRWLGYAQGVLVAFEVAKLDEMKEINKRHAARPDV